MLMVILGASLRENIDVVRIAVPDVMRSTVGYYLRFTLRPLVSSSCSSELRKTNPVTQKKMYELFGTKKTLLANIFNISGN